MMASSATSEDLTPEAVKAAAGEYELNGVTALTLTSPQIQRITPLALCSNLRRLVLHGTAVVSLAPLVQLRHLEELDARGNAVARLTDLRSLPALKTVRLEGNRVDNISTVLRDLGCGFSRLARLDLRRLDGSEANPVCLAEGYNAAALRSVNKSLQIVDGRRPHDFYDVYESAAQAAAALDATPDEELQPPAKTVEGLGCCEPSNDPVFIATAAAIEAKLAHARTDLLGTQNSDMHHSI